ncbi:MAG: acetaldehyde dehydrogenase (acetylating) [Colwellia sp.]|jgi:acetaldehyde dehydrogenase (acetylating)|tara:strand:+ start:4068 stop:4448 length:381 start_codon:yes stop_codon:yes gene_type:complete
MNSGKFSIAIIGAGNAGIEMMQKMIEVDFVDLVAVVDKNEEAPGIKLAQEKGIPTTNDFMSLFKDDNELDIIIDVTGIKAVRDELRSFMQESNNKHTVIMHERISALLVSLFKGKLVDMKSSDGIY